MMGESVRSGGRGSEIKVYIHIYIFVVLGIVLIPETPYLNLSCVRCIRILYLLNEHLLNS